ncbi:MAG: hypothetical protein JSV39_00815 [Candidatus Aenigmatarchaeota archaeon]|nr:MAG: hypothetical protein JSV39_00815 [Candidatus Aenigmarchaeota archaeon]
MIKEGRIVEFFDISDLGFDLWVNVHQMEGDCVKKQHPDYDCEKNCDGFYMYAGFFPQLSPKETEGIFFTQALLTPQEYIHPVMEESYGVRGGDFDKLEALSRAMGLPVINEERSTVYLPLIGEEVLGIKRYTCGMSGIMKGDSLKICYTLKRNFRIFKDQSKPPTEKNKLFIASKLIGFPGVREQIQQAYGGEFIKEVQEYIKEGYNPFKR